MCQLPSPLSPQCNSNSNSNSNSNPNPNPIQDHAFSYLHSPLINKTPKPTTKTWHIGETPQTTLSLAVREAQSIATIALPMILTGLLLYSRSIVSMLFLGRLGNLPLAGGSLALAFANITGYSILSGLASGMDPICSQAFGANKPSLLGLSLQRTVLLLLLSSLPISLLWLYIKPILLFFNQDESIAITAQSYLLCSLPDLLAQSLLHPLRIYLRSQSITLPLTFCAALAVLLHVPINLLLVSRLGMGVKGVAFSGVLTNFNLVAFLIIYILASGVHNNSWDGFTLDCFKEWRSLLELAIPSCVSVCLEWWWYEIMILLSGLLLNPRANVGSMGILIQTTALVYIFPSSLSIGVSTRVGNELGANRPGAARRAALVGLTCSLLLGLMAFVFAVTVRNAWARMFTDDAEILALTAAVLPVIGLCEIGNCPQTAGCGVLRGTARPRVGANVNLGCFYLVGMPVALALAFCFGFDFRGLWLGLLAAQGTCGVTMLVVVGRTDWGFEAERARRLTGDGDVAEVREEGTVSAGMKEDSLDLLLLLGGDDETHNNRYHDSLV